MMNVSVGKVKGILGSIIEEAPCTSDICIEEALLNTSTKQALAVPEQQAIDITLRFINFSAMFSPGICKQILVRAN